MGRQEHHFLSVSMVTVFCLLRTGVPQQQQISYDLDRLSTCKQTLMVYDQDLILNARSNVAPANPPTECIVFLQSAYEKADGRYRLQIIIEQLQIGDCAVYLAIFNGFGVTGNYLRNLGCNSGSTDIIYTTDREATVRFTRPQYLYQTSYAVTLKIRTYADSNDPVTAIGVAKLGTGPIIGIVVGIVMIIALAILLCWCYHTGYLLNFMDSLGVSNNKKTYIPGSVDSNLEKNSTTSSTLALKNGIDYQDPVIWTSITNDGSTPRQFRKGMPRMAGRGGLDTSSDKLKGVEMRTKPGEGDRYGNVQGSNNAPLGRNYENTGSKAPPGRDSHAYEPFENKEGSPHFFRRKDDKRDSRGSRRSQNSMQGKEEQQRSKETTIDDPGVTTTEDELETHREKVPLDSEYKKGNQGDTDLDSEVAKLNRLDSSELQGEADVDIIASPIHVNAGVRASIPDLTEVPTASPRAKKRSSTSPKSRKRGKDIGGREPDPTALPPEAFDPVFTVPTSQEQYPGEFKPMQQYGGFPMFAPYGMIPVGPMAPGAQTYAYAYQTAAPVGPPNQGAYFVQSVPTAEGQMRNTAFMMQSTHTPKHKNSKGKGVPDYTSTPGDSPRPGRSYPASSPPDMSVILAGAEPDVGHRSMAMKSFADPSTGIQTTQVVWTDNVPDPTDPEPGDSCQVTRKTTTRVTTRSGRGDLPSQTTTMLDYADPTTDFLSPSSSKRAAIAPATLSPSTSVVDYYTGHGQGRARTPDVIHDPPSRSTAFRDRIRLKDSSA